MKEKKRSMTWMALLVFGLFALCVLQVLLAGANVYKGLAERGEEQHKDRTTVQYFATRVRQSRSTAVEEFGGCQALALGETIDGKAYVTRVYLYDGYIRELFSTPDAPLEPADGEKILPAEALELSLQHGLLRVKIDSRLLLLHISAGKEVPG